MFNVEPESYTRLFNKNELGEKVLLELVALYYDRPSYTRGDTHETAYKEGQRSVIAYILAKAGQSNEEQGILDIEE